jgi:V-type H+-transporting ATPase subunit a
MFGDIGHGGLYLALGIWMTTSAQARKIVPAGIYGIRYLVLLMGIFSFYAGWIYN